MDSKNGLELTVDDIKRIHSSLVKAVQENRISEERLNEAVGRILVLKECYVNSNVVDTQPADFQDKIYTLNHRLLAQKIASLALQVKEKDLHKIGPLSDQKIFIVAPRIVETTLQATSLFTMGKSVDSYFFNGLSPSSAEVEAVKNQVKAFDVVIVCSYNAWKNPSAVALTQLLLESGKPVIVLSVRDPLDGALFSNADLIFTSFSPTVPSIQAICDLLVDKFK